MIVTETFVHPDVLLKLTFKLNQVGRNNIIHIQIGHNPSGNPSGWWAVLVYDDKAV